MKNTVIKVFLVTGLFAGLHSLLASRQAKLAAERWLGRRRRNAFYRPFFLAQSFLSLGALAWALHDLPNATLYRLRGLPAFLLRLGQAAGLAWAAAAAIQVGLLRISGLAGLWAWLRGDLVVPPEPEAQGPAMDAGRLKTSGLFRLSRHPLNFSPLPVFWLNPVMTVKLLAFNLAATLYLVVGSIHEETRLRAAYGAPYRRYLHSDVPFYLPRLKT